MPVPTLVTDLSTTAASNSPSGSDNVFPDLDNYLRALSAFLASIRDNSGNGWTTPYLPLTYSAGTANGVVYLNGSKVVTTGSALVFDGTNFSTTGTATATKLIPTGGAATGNGMYLPAANTLAWSNNGAETMRLDSSGNLGLGVTPSAWGSGFKLVQMAGRGSYVAADVNYNYTYLGANNYYNGTAWTYTVNGYATRFSQGDGAFYWYTAPSGTAGNAISFTQAMTLDASGNLVVGSTTAAARIVSAGSSATNFKALILRNGDGTTNSSVSIDFEASTGTSGDEAAMAGRIAGVRTGSGTSGALTFSTTNAGVLAERARITSGGDLLVAKTAAGVTTVGAEMLASGYVSSTLAGSTNATSTLEVYSTGASAFRFYVSMDGTVNATNTTISAISDQRLKENVRDLDVGLNAIMALKPRKFDWKAGKGKDIKDDRGFIAQEFEQVFPDLIDEWKDPAPEGEEPYKSVRQDLIPVLVKAIQEQQALITALTARVAALEGV